MSRSGYYDDGDGDYWRWIMWRGAVKSAIRGKRGQALLKDILATLDAMPMRRLIAHELETRGEVCALGAVGLSRGVRMAGIDPEDYGAVANVFGISEALAREIMFENDEGGSRRETPEQRFERMRKWILSEIVDAGGAEPVAS